jgi:hypothetical protein
MQAGPSVCSNEGPLSPPICDIHVPEFDAQKLTFHRIELVEVCYRALPSKSRELTAGAATVDAR